MIKKDLQKVIREFLSNNRTSLITEVSDETLDLQQKFFNDMLVNKSKIVQRYGKDAEKVMKGKAMNLAKKETEKMEKQKLKELVRKSLMDEAEFSKEYDDNPALKGKQKELPDALQKSIIAKKGVKEAYSEESELDKYERILYQLQNMNRSSNPSDESTKRKKIEDLKKKIAKLKSKVTEGYYGTTNVESYIDALGYESFEDFFNDNPGAETALMNWIESVPEFRQSLEGAGLLSEDIDLGHEDNEPHMIKGELYQIGKYSMELYAALEELEEMGGEIDFPAWWQSKITTAKNNISGAKHYLEFEMNEPKINATVDALTGEEPHEGEPESHMMNEVEVGDIVKIKKEYGGGKGKVTDKKGSFIIINGKSYHESDVVKSSGSLEEKKLTKAEKAKKEDIVKGMKKSFKGDESAMYAIATAKAKKVAETIVKKLKND